MAEFCLVASLGSTSLESSLGIANVLIANRLLGQTSQLRVKTIRPARDYSINPANTFTFLWAISDVAICWPIYMSITISTPGGEVFGQIMTNWFLERNRFKFHIWCTFHENVYDVRTSLCRNCGLGYANLVIHFLLLIQLPVVSRNKIYIESSSDETIRYLIVQNVLSGKHTIRWKCNSLKFCSY